MSPLASSNATGSEKQRAASSSHTDSVRAGHSAELCCIWNPRVAIYSIWQKSQQFPSGIPAAVWEGSVQTVGRALQRFSNFQWQEAADVTLGCHFSLSSICTDSVVKNKAVLIGYTPLRTRVYLIQSVQLSNNWAYKNLHSLEQERFWSAVQVDQAICPPEWTTQPWH